MYSYKKIKLKDGSTKDEHRILMEKYLGRKLEKCEIIHHIDYNKKKNNIDNLQLMTRAEHLLYHKSKGDIANSIISETGKKILTQKNSKVSEKIAIYILMSNEKPKFLMQKFNISKFIISRIRCGITWKYLRGQELIDKLHLVKDKTICYY